MEYFVCQFKFYILESWNNAKLQKDQKLQHFHIYQSSCLGSEGKKYWISYFVQKKGDLSVCKKTSAFIQSTKDVFIHLIPPKCIVSDHKSHLVQLVIMKNVNVLLLRIIKELKRICSQHKKFEVRVESKFWIHLAKP